MDAKAVRTFLKRWSARPNAWAWAAAVLLTGFLAYYWDTHEPAPPPSATEAESPESAATFIPAGYVLVPIEVSNFESLDSILGKFGLVDLYVPNENPKGRPRKVGERLKILRAPLNPSRFAVLVREEESARLVAQTGPFITVIQNPKRGGTGFVNGSNTLSDLGDEESGRNRRRRSRITVEALGDS